PSDETSGKKVSEPVEPPKKSTLETRVETQVPQNVLSPNILVPDLTTIPVQKEIPPPESSLENSQPPTMQISVPPAPPPPEEPNHPLLDVSTIQIGVGDWLPQSFAKDQPKEPLPDAQANRTPIFGEPQNTVIDQTRQHSHGRTAEWQQTPTVEAPGYQSPQ